MKKKIFILILALLLISTVSGYANTYDSILKESGYTDIHNKYINKDELKVILNLIFKEDISMDLSGVGHATGYDFFKIMEELKYHDIVVENKEIYYNRALTYLSLYELLDWYFPVVSNIHGIESYTGKLSKSSSGYTLTYGGGEVKEFSEFPYLNVREEYLTVNVIVKNNEIIEVCESEKNVHFSMLYKKREVSGKLYLLYDDGVIIESDGELLEFPLIKDYKVLNKKGDNVVVLMGNYKKNMDLAAVIIGRND